MALRHISTNLVNCHRRHKTDLRNPLACSLFSSRRSKECPTGRVQCPTSDPRGSVHAPIRFKLVQKVQIRFTSCPSDRPKWTAVVRSRCPNPGSLAVQMALSVHAVLVQRRLQKGSSELHADRCFAGCKSTRQMSCNAPATLPTGDRCRK